MTATPDIIMLCAGGHARVLLEALKRAGRRVDGIADADTALHGRTLDEIPVLGGDDKVLARNPNTVVLVNGLGNMAKSGDSGLMARRALFSRFKAKNYQFLTVVSPYTSVSAHAKLGEGCQIIVGAIVQPGCD